MRFLLVQKSTVKRVTAEQELDVCIAAEFINSHTFPDYGAVWRGLSEHLNRRQYKLVVSLMELKASTAEVMGSLTSFPDEDVAFAARQLLKALKPAVLDSEIHDLAVTLDNALYRFNGTEERIY